MGRTSDPSPGQWLSDILRLVPLPHGVSPQTEWNRQVSTFLEGELNETGKFGGALGSVGSYVVLEPCNYASNMAYYNAALQACNYQDWSVDSETQSAIMKTLVTTGYDLAMLHGSMTTLGLVWDVQAEKPLLQCLPNHDLKC